MSDEVKVLLKDTLWTIRIDQEAGMAEVVSKEPMLPPTRVDRQERPCDHRKWGTGTFETLDRLDASMLASVQEQSMAVTEEQKVGFFRKAAQWLLAEASAIGGKLDDAAYDQRIAACKGCDRLQPRPDPLVGFCGACGCGRNPRAELTVKGRMPKATCPLNKWQT